MEILMHLLKTVVLTLLLGLSTSCAITGPADDGFENSLESVDIGKLRDNELLVRYIPASTRR